MTETIERIAEQKVYQERVKLNGFTSGDKFIVNCKNRYGVRIQKTLFYEGFSYEHPGKVLFLEENINPQAILVHSLDVIEDSEGEFINFNRIGTQTPEVCLREPRDKLWNYDYHRRRQIIGGTNKNDGKWLEKNVKAVQ